MRGRHRLDGRSPRHGVRGRWGEHVTYTKTIGPFTTAQCGEHKVNNTASLTTNDTGATASASASVDVSVSVQTAERLHTRYRLLEDPCRLRPTGRRRTPILPDPASRLGGWGEDAERDDGGVRGPAARDEELGRRDAPSNGINKLYAQLLGTKLNGASSADISSVSATIAAAERVPGEPQLAELEWPLERAAADRARLDDDTQLQQRARRARSLRRGAQR